MPAVPSNAAVATFDLNGKVLPVPAAVQPLFTPTKVGRYELSTRVVMPPLTRCRAIGTVPQPPMAVYYGQRAVKGALLIAEGTVVAPEGHGYPHTPGIFTAEQIEAWKPIIKTVKDKGSVFFCQLWHVGRASHQEYQPDGKAPLAPSAIAISTSDPSWVVYTSKGALPYPVPREATLAEIKQVVEYHRQGARNAIDAGFDGVEVHSGNGYLLDQFIKTRSNKRTDAYGGPIENRARLLLEVVQAVVDEVGADRVGVRLTPFVDFLDVEDETPYATFSYILEKLQPLGLAYVHMVEPRVKGNDDLEDVQYTLEPFRKLYKGTFIAAGGYKADTAAQAVQSGHADLVAFGRYFVSTPDLVERVLVGAPFNAYDRNTFYSQGLEGFTDYPTLEQVEAARQ